MANIKGIKDEKKREEIRKEGVDQREKRKKKEIEKKGEDPLTCGQERTRTRERRTWGVHDFNPQEKREMLLTKPC